MIKRLSASAAGLALILVLIVSSVCALDFQYSADIENKGGKQYKAVKLTPEIYNNITENMADLELYDAKNQPVPYFVHSFTESEVETTGSYEMKLINSFVKNADFYYDYTLKDPQDEDVTATSIQIQAGEEGFAKQVVIYGSYDSVKWEKVQDDTLYDVDSSQKLEMSFDDVKKYTCYRFKISNNLEKISFSSVTLKYSRTQQKKEYFTGTVSPGFTAESRGKDTVLKIKGLKNLKLSSITLKTDSMFKRKVTFEGNVSKILYNLYFKNTNYRDLTLPLEQYTVSADTAEIVIDNKDDKPVKILGVEARYLVDELIFDGSKSGAFTLRFGNNTLGSPKSYDISNYKEHILKEGYDVLTIKNIKAGPPKAPSKPQRDYKLIFNITISIVAVVMGVIVFLKLKK